MPQSQKNFMQSMGGQGGVPLSALLQQSAHQDPRLRSQQEASGWASPVGQIAYLGGQFLEGVRQGRVQKFLMSEHQREKEWNALAQGIDRRLQDPDLTPAGRAALMKAAQDVASQRFVEETKDVAKDKKSVPGMIAGVLQNIAVGMSGGQMPQGSKKINPGDVLLGLERQIGENPEYSRKATLSAAESAWLGAVQEAAKEAGGDASRVDRTMIMRHATPVLSMLSNRLGQEEADQFVSRRLSGYAPSQKAIAEESEARYENDLFSSMRAGQQPTITPAPGDAAGFTVGPPAVRPGVMGVTPEQARAAYEHQFQVKHGAATPLQSANFYDRSNPNDPGFPAKETFSPTGNRIWIDARTQTPIDAAKFVTTPPRREVTVPITINDGKREIPAQRNDIDGTISFIDPKTSQTITTAPMNLAKYGLQLGQKERDPYAAQTAILNRQAISAGGQAVNRWVATQQSTRASFAAKAQEVKMAASKGAISPQQRDAQLADLRAQADQNLDEAFEASNEQYIAATAGLSDAEVAKRAPKPHPGYKERKARIEQAQSIGSIRANRK
jgi:hypothetical protein